MANFKNTVPRKYGNEYEFPVRCMHCSEVPKQGWSFMGSFIWCENDECDNRLHSPVATADELGQWWDMVQEGKCSPSTFPAELMPDAPVCRSCCGTGKAYNAGSDSHGRCRECKGSGEESVEMPLSESQAKKWDAAENASREKKDLTPLSGRHIGDLDDDQRK